MSDSMLYLGDCLEQIAHLPDGSIDAVVTDPPYGISFMGKHWDRFDIDQRVGKRDVSKLGVRLTGSAETPNRKETARTASAFANAAGEAGAYDFSLKGNRAFQAWVEQVGVELLRVLKPGGHALVFGGTRTYHRLAAGLEDAGFEIRDTLAWIFGQGFPKSLNLDGEYEGWGTALKPAFEPVTLARKPLQGGVRANVAAHGVGALHIAACLVDVVGERPLRENLGRSDDGTLYGAGLDGSRAVGTTESGRWPANVVLDEEAGALLDGQSGHSVSRVGKPRGTAKQGMFANSDWNAVGTEHDDAGGASRFFYCAKVSRAERNAGLDGFEERPGPSNDYGTKRQHPLKPEGEPNIVLPVRNHHPTVKPIALMRWLVRLVTPPGGVVLDPFLGSGSTGCAASLEDVSFIGIEREADYMRIAEARIAYWSEHREDGLRIAQESVQAESRRREIREAGQTSLFDSLTDLSDSSTVESVPEAKEQ